MTNLNIVNHSIHCMLSKSYAFYKMLSKIAYTLVIQFLKDTTFCISFNFFLSIKL